MGCSGSVVLPLKALVMSMLTAVAATGIIVFIFPRRGRVRALDRLRRLPAVSDHGGTTESNEREAIAAGLERTGRLGTAASLMLAVAIGAFATSRVVFLKEVGVGIAAAVLIDAFIVRALPVPALMALLGKWSWWAPAPLARLQRRIGRVEPAGISVPGQRSSAVRNY